MPRVKCGKCQAVIKLDGVPRDGTIHCPECGASFRVRSKASEPASPPPAAAKPDTPPPTGAPADSSPPIPSAPASGPPDFSFVATATTSQPQSGGGIDLGFLADKQPAPAAAVEPTAASPTEPPSSPTPTASPSPAAPSSANVPSSVNVSPSPDIPPSSNIPPTPEPQPAAASPYASPAPAPDTAKPRRAAMQAGSELLAMPAPSLIGGMFDGSFRYFLTPRIVKIFWILALVAAGIGLTLVLGSYFLMLFGIMVADAAPATGPQYATELGPAADTLMQFQPSPSSNFTVMGKLGTVLFSTLSTLASCTIILMWLLFLRMILEAFCVLFGIRVNLRTMAEALQEG